eukprot:jgi/Chrzof1/12366/Cz06g31300.t1
MSLWQGVIGAQADLAAIPTTFGKIRRAAEITKLFASEIAGTIALAPYAYRSIRLYKSLPLLPSPTSQHSTTASQQQRRHDVYLAKQIPYSHRPRTCCDVYVPAAALSACPSASQCQAKPTAPVVVFCHGGVWAAGASWHYAPMAVALARLGVVACVVQYSLYPDALVPQLVEEVAEAFNWVMEHVHEHGGDVNKVSLVGHSAGAQLCMMALLHKAVAAHTMKMSNGSMTSNMGCDGRGQQHVHNTALSDPRMPAMFVGITGVYDIAKHYVYESERGVQELSTMKRAMGGYRRFASMSPSVILGAALHLQQTLPPTTTQEEEEEEEEGNSSNTTSSNNSSASNCSRHPQGRTENTTMVGNSNNNSSSSSSSNPQGSHGSGKEGANIPSHSTSSCFSSERGHFHSAFPLTGEAISHRVGFERPSDSYPAMESKLAVLSASDMDDVMDFPLEAAGQLPPTVLMSSCSDVTVPWYESAEMYWRLYDAGVPVKHLVYNKVGHGDFVVKWPTDYSHQQSTMQSNMQSVIQSGTAECGNGMQPSSQSGTNDSMAGKGRSTTSNDSYNDSYNGQHKSTESSGKTAVCSTQHPAAAAALMSALPPYNADLAAMVSGRVAVRFIRKRQVEQAAAQQQRPSEQASPAAIESQVLAR